MFATDQEVLEWASVAGVDSVEFENNITQRPAQRKQASLQLDEAASLMSGTEAWGVLLSGFKDESNDDTNVAALGKSDLDEAKEP